MKYIKDAAGQVHGFDETVPGDVEAMNKLFFTGGTINAGCTDVTGSWPPAKTKAELWVEYQDLAKVALSESDVTMMRIGEGVSMGTTSWTAADVVAFVQWRKSLRTILSQTQPATIPTSLPTKPTYPAGT